MAAHTSTWPSLRTHLNTPTHDRSNNYALELIINKLSVLAVVGLTTMVLNTHTTGITGRLKLKLHKVLVWEDEPASFDSRFYWAADLPKALDNVDAVDEDGNPLLDEDGVQIVTLGLRSYAISTAKSQAAGLLSATDWYVSSQG
jgi:hypothetical protein